MNLSKQIYIDLFDKYYLALVKYASSFVDKDNAQDIGQDAFVEIAFYGGSFTAIEKSVQKSFLEKANIYLSNGSISEIRLSTRPDYIDDDILDFLFSFVFPSVGGISCLKVKFSFISFGGFSPQKRFCCLPTLLYMPATLHVYSSRAGVCLHLGMIFR